jgi:hypothetical protein
LQLTLEVLGVLFGAAVLRGALGAISWAAGVATVAAVVGIIALANDGWSTAKRFQAQGETNRALPRSTLNNAGGAPMSANEAFLAWADSKIPRRGRVFLICTPKCGGMEQWVTWRLLPRPLVDSSKDADWILMYNALPRDAGLRGAAAQSVERFGKRLYVARVPR